jgi:hypothetical protein
MRGRHAASANNFLFARHDRRFRSYVICGLTALTRIWHSRFQNVLLLVVQYSGA